MHVREDNIPTGRRSYRVPIKWRPNGSGRPSMVIQTVADADGFGDKWYQWPLGVPVSLWLAGLHDARTTFLSPNPNTLRLLVAGGEWIWRAISPRGSIWVEDGHHTLIARVRHRHRWKNKECGKRRSSYTENLIWRYAQLLVILFRQELCISSNSRRFIKRIQVRPLNSENLKSFSNTSCKACLFFLLLLYGYIYVCIFEQLYFYEASFT